MALFISHKDISFGIGDSVRVHLKVVEGEKTRTSIFEGMVIAIKGKGDARTFTVRRIGAQKVGIEQIFPIAAPTLEKIEVKRAGTKGVRHAKLYYTREKSKREIENIYSRVALKDKPEVKKSKPKAKIATKTPVKAKKK